MTTVEKIAGHAECYTTFTSLARKQQNSKISSLIMTACSPTSQVIVTRLLNLGVCGSRFGAERCGQCRGSGFTTVLPEASNSSRDDHRAERAPSKRFPGRACDNLLLRKNSSRGDCCAAGLGFLVFAAASKRAGVRDSIYQFLVDARLQR